MILRKPYAFFIKFFRIFHVALTVITIFLLTQLYGILEFYNDYSATIVNVIGQDLVGELIPGTLFVLPFVAIALLTLILLVLIFKKKPFIFYIFSIVAFITLFIITIFVNVNLIEMSERILDLRGVRLLRDFVLIVFVLNVINVLVLVVRSIGFDIKKFGFGDDLNELNISEEDREEFELDINIDHNLNRRKFNYFIRRAKYVYKENKLFSNVFIALVFLGIGFISFEFVVRRNNTFEMNEYITVNGITLKVENAYLTNTDYEGNIINEDYYYLLVDVNVRALANKTKLDIATVSLKIDNYTYIHQSDGQNDFIEFGKIYNSEDLSLDAENKILVYEIPKQLIDRELVFELVNKNIPFEELGVNYVGVRPINLTYEIPAKTYNLGETINIDNHYIEDYDVTIEKYELANDFKIEYKRCYGECYNLYEYIYPVANRNYKESVLKLTGELIYEDRTIQNVFNLYDFIEEFGTVEYTINGTTKRIGSFEEIVSKKTDSNDVYIEVNSELAFAETIKIKFVIKNETYYYTLK